MNFAPVSLFVYNRIDCLKQTVEALLKNKESCQTDLLIFSDGPKENAIEEDRKAIKNIREYIKTILGFRSVFIVNNEMNKGLANSIIAGVSHAIEKFGRTIVLEDDLVVSTCFLKYMNDALQMYENNDAVISIHAYNYPINDPNKLPATFLLKCADCLGWATWKRGWELFENDATKLFNELTKRNLEYEFDFSDNYPFTKMLEDQTNGKNYSWAVKWYASAFLKNKLTLYPNYSLVKHIGLSGGTNYGSDPFLNKINLTDEIKVLPIPIEENKEARQAIIDFYSERKKYYEQNEKHQPIKWQRLRSFLKHLFPR